MPRCALPEHINDPDEIENAFPDDSQFGGFFGNLWKRWNKATKHIEAFGPRCPKGIAFTYWPPFILLKKWREVPTVLFARKGWGYWRFEKDGAEDRLSAVDNPKEFLAKPENAGYYLTRIQPWCRSHWQIQWPLFFCFHKYKDQADVVPVGERADRDGKINIGYIGAKRDADKVFWYVAAFLGRNFK